jgi:hypothetical protein
LSFPAAFKKVLWGIKFPEDYPELKFWKFRRTLFFAQFLDFCLLAIDQCSARVMEAIPAAASTGKT